MILQDIASLERAQWEEIDVVSSFGRILAKIERCDHPPSATMDGHQVSRGASYCRLSSTQGSRTAPDDVDER